MVLRRNLLLSLDDLLAVVREFLNPEVSRSGLDRCLRRHGLANLKALERDEEKWNPVFLVNHATTEKLEQDDVSIKHHLALVAQPPRPTHKPFKACEPGYLHVDVTYLPQMADESARRYLFVAIDPWPGR